VSDAIIAALISGGFAIVAALVGRDIVLTGRVHRETRIIHGLLNGTRDDAEREIDELARRRALGPLEKP
jgi:hypothetical protein